MTDLIETAKKRENSLREKAMTKITELQKELELLKSTETENFNAMKELNNNNSEVGRLTAELESLKNGYDSQAMLYEKSLAEKTSENEKLVKIIQSLNEKIKLIEAQLYSVSSQNQNLKPYIQKIKEKVRSTTSALRSDLALIKQDAASIVSIFSFKNILLSKIKNFSLKVESSHNLLNIAYQKELKARKELFNQIQELRGNIRVFCRIRCLNSVEIDNKESMVCFLFQK